MKKIWKFIKFLIRSLILILLIIIILFGISVYFIKTETIAQNLARFTLNLTGFSKTHVIIEKITTTELIAKNIYLNNPDKFHIDEVRINFDLSPLLSSKLEKIIINKLVFNGLDLHGEIINKKYISFGDLNNFVRTISAFKQNQTNYDATFNIKKLEINDSTLVIEDQKHKLLLPFTFSSFNNARQSNQKNYESQIDLSEVYLDMFEFDIPGMGLLSLNLHFTGDIPFVWNGTNFKMENANIKSITAGDINFIPYTMGTLNTTEGSGSTDVYALFTDFQYNDFNANLSINEDQVLKSSFSFNGSNKAFYEGQTVDLTLNLNIELKDLIKSIEAMYEISSEASEANQQSLMENQQ